MFSDPIIYALNSAAVGDLMAAAPVVKWAINTFHKSAEYKVAMFPDFRDLYHFVPDSNIIELNKSYDSKFAVRCLNSITGVGGNFARLTPSRVKLTQYASIGLTGRVLPDKVVPYVPLEEVDVSHYGVDFSKAAIFITTYRDITRAWSGEEIHKVAEYVTSKGLTPVFIGKRGAISIWKTLARTDFEYKGLGVDLIDKTSFRELFTIMNKAKVIFGVDSGPLHIAFSTKTPVVAGFTNVDPYYRVPDRGEAKTVSVYPKELICRFCQSNWNLDFHNYTKCPRGMSEPECTTLLKGELFIKGFEELCLPLT